jgi:predicted permease
MLFGKRPEERLDAELRDHFERMVQEFVAEGADAAEARRRARLEFGGMEQIKEECRDVRGRWLEDLGKDLLYSLRTLRRSPAFAAAAVGSLALGIGANTAIFSLINAVMLRSLPVKDPARLAQIARITPEGTATVVSYPIFTHMRDRLQTVENASVEQSANPAITIDGAEEVVDAEYVSGSYYALLGVRAAIGRLLELADDTIAPESPPAVIGYGYWQRRFGMDAGVIGKRFSLNGRVFTIVGVTQRGFHGSKAGRDPDIAIPLTMMLSEEQRHERSNNMLIMLARLKPGVMRAQADAELQVLWRPFLERYAEGLPEKERARVLAQRAAVVDGSRGFSMLRASYSQALMVLMGIVGLILLLSCANVSGLLLARAAGRQREIAIRLAIGAGRGRMARQFLAESLVLAAAGGCAGTLLARWFDQVVVTMMANGGTLTLSTAPDWRVLAFTAGISAITCLLSGLAPGLLALRADLNPAMKEGRSGGRQRAGKGLVVAQLAISMVLLVGATLFVGSLAMLYRVDRGVRTEGVLTLWLRSGERYSEARGRAAMAAVVHQLAAVPGVISASAAKGLPISGSLWTRTIHVEGDTRPDGDSCFNVIAPAYFKTLGTPFISGREFDERDTTTSPKVTVVNESFARHYFGGRSPIGNRVTSLGVTYEIVGVVRDAKYQSLRESVMSTMYIPWTQREGEQPASYIFMARVAGGDPMRLAPGMDQLVRTADPGLRVRSARTYESVIDATLVTERIMATLGGFFGVLAVVVASLGMFGAVAFQVSRRVNEFGIRIAVGAGRRDIVGLVMRDVVTMFAVGSAAGALGALALTGLARKMLFGVGPTDIGVFAVAAAILGAAALAAGWIPAWRASRADPLSALRHE